MAGPREQASDTSLDDILSSIRRIVSDDLNGAEKLRDKMEAARHAQPAPATATQSSTPEVAVPAEQSAPVELGNAQPPQNLADVENTAALIAAARAAAGTPARDYVEAEPRLSQAEVARPRDSLAPFDRTTTPLSPDITDQPTQHAMNGAGTTTLDTPIVLPTEVEMTGQAATVPCANGQEVANGYDAFDGQHAANGHDVQEAALTLGEAIQAPVNEPMPEPVTTDPQSLEPVTLNHVPPTDAVQDMNGHAQSELTDPQPLELAPAATRSATTEPAVISSAPHGSEVQALNGAPTANAMNEETVNGHTVVTTPAQPISPEPVPAQPTASEPAQSGTSSTVLEQTVTRLLRPMLKDWLDENMPRLIEQALREDVLAQGDDKAV